MRRDSFFVFLNVGRFWAVKKQNPENIQKSGNRRTNTEKRKKAEICFQMSANSVSEAWSVFIRNLVWLVSLKAKSGQRGLNFISKAWSVSKRCFDQRGSERRKAGVWLRVFGLV